MAKDRKGAAGAAAGSGSAATTAAAAADEKRRLKADRKQTPGDRSRARMKHYGLIALALGCSLPLLVPLLSRLLLWINPPTYTELLQPTPQQLHGVFFSGRPHIVFCTNRTGNEVPRLVKRVADAADDYALATEVKPPTPIPPMDDDDDEESAGRVAQAYAAELTRAETDKLVKEGWMTSSLGPVSVVTLDCAAPLPSGQSVLQRFKLQLPVVHTPPTPVGSLATMVLPPALWVANGDRPTWIPSELFTTEDRVMPSKVLSHVVSKALPRTQVIQSEKVLARDCTGSRKHCALILHAGPLSLAAPAVTSTIRAIHHHLPFIKVVSVDVSSYTLGLQKNLGKLDHGPAPGAGGQWPRLLYFRRQALSNATAPSEQDKSKGKADKGKITGKEENKKPESTLLVKSYKGRFQSTPVLHFLSSLADAPRFDSAGATVHPAQTSGARAMAKLKASPQLNSGANNFRKAKLPPRGKMSDGRAIPTRQEQQAARKAREEERKARAQTKESLEREERERAMRRREQMEAEAAESNFVTEAPLEPESRNNANQGGYSAGGGGGFSAHDESDESGEEGAEEEEETVNLDDESEL